MIVSSHDASSGRRSALPRRSAVATIDAARSRRRDVDAAKPRGDISRRSAAPTEIPQRDETRTPHAHATVASRPRKPSSDIARVVVMSASTVSFIFFRVRRTVVAGSR